MPLSIWPNLTSISDAMKYKCEQLKSVSIDVDYYSETINDKSHWIYEPDKSISYHRQLIRNNFTVAKGYWTETNVKRRSNLHKSVKRFENDYAYPVNTINKPNLVLELLEYLENHRVVSFGRWGTWRHINSDIAVSEAISLAEKIVS